MIKNLLLACFCACSVFVKAQVGTKVYLDSSLVTTAEDKHVYYRVVSADDSGYLTRIFYKSGKIFRQSRSSVPDGPWHGAVREFWENGNPKELAQYDNGRSVGGLQTWYETGQPKLLGYRSNSPVNPGELMVSQYWSENGEQTVIDGKGHYAGTNGEIREEGEINNEVRVGVWKGEIANLNLHFEDTYSADGKFVSGKSSDAMGNQYEYSEIMTKPEFPGGIQKFYEFVRDNFKTPDDTKGGRMILSFVVMPNGELDEIKVARAIDEATSKEGVRMMSKSPRWQPAKMRGAFSRCSFALPIVIAGN